MTSLRLKAAVKIDGHDSFYHGHVLFPLEAEYSRDTRPDDKNN